MIDVKGYNQKIELFKAKYFFEKEEISPDEYNKAQQDMQKSEFDKKYFTLGNFNELDCYKIKDTDEKGDSEFNVQNALLLEIFNKLDETNKALDTIKKIMYFFLTLSIISITAWFFSTR